MKAPLRRTVTAASAATRRSQPIRTAREATTIASAWLELTAEASTSNKMTSRIPAPAGAGMNRMPRGTARAMPPMHNKNIETLQWLAAPARMARWTPRAIQVRKAHPNARAS